jgi:hypothetical protein
MKRGDPLCSVIHVLDFLGLPERQGMAEKPHKS